MVNFFIGFLVGALAVAGLCLIIHAIALKDYNV